MSGYSWKELRKKHPEFVYQGFSYQEIGSDLEIIFDFLIRPDIDFKPTIVIKNIKSSQIDSLDKEVIDNFVFHLGLMEMFSYWKATCSPVIKIKAGYLNPDQIKWWHDLLIKGMGQFFYTNQINFKEKDFVKITEANKKQLPCHKKRLNQDKLLVNLGGGKDSIVTLELMKKSGRRPACFLFNPTLAMRQIINVSGVKQTLMVERTIDQKLLDLNKKGYLNGHVPFSALLALLSCFCGLLFDYGLVLNSQERSSNEGNINYLGLEINHQYSKSFEFENKFRSYLKNYLTSDLNYFSFLRPLYELQISKIFSQYKRYFPIFRSCNVGQKTNSWCGQCPKCLFVFISLYPFLEDKDLVRIFGQDLFKKKSLLPILKGLIGLEKCKPFECVGTREETLTALELSYKKAEEYSDKTGVDLPYLLQFFKKKITINDSRSWVDYSKKEILEGWDEENNLPVEFRKILQSSLKDLKEETK